MGKDKVKAMSTLKEPKHRKPFSARNSPMS